jgi:hypothetical protein
VLRDGRLTTVIGWSRSRVFRVPLGRGAARGYLVESSDAVTLPRVWPSLRQVDFSVDTQVVGLNGVIEAAMRLPSGGRLLELLAPVGLPLARLIGSRAGGYAVEVMGDGGRVSTTALVARRRSYMTAALPATLAAAALAGGALPPPGVVPADRLCDPDELFVELRKAGIEIQQS